MVRELHLLCAILLCFWRFFPSHFLNKTAFIYYFVLFTKYPIKLFLIVFRGIFKKIFFFVCLNQNSLFD